jgi:nodulation protein E
MPRVLITGLGCVCALGEDADRTWEAMTRGVCGIGPLTLVSPEGLRHPIAGEARGYVPEACFDRHELSRLDRFAQFGVLAGREAVADAGLTFNGGSWAAPLAVSRPWRMATSACISAVEGTHLL